jgi:hypothetical protein
MVSATQGSEDVSAMQDGTGMIVRTSAVPNTMGGSVTFRVTVPRVTLIGQTHEMVSLTLAVLQSREGSVNAAFPITVMHVNSRAALSLGLPMWNRALALKKRSMRG